MRLTKKLLLSIIEQQDFRCALTGRDLTPDTASIDHRQPLSRGGEHCVTNVQVVHSEVNSAKGGMTNAEFIQMCCEVADLARGAGVSLNEFRAAN